jgi:hypothetical protein
MWDFFCIFAPKFENNHAFMVKDKLITLSLAILSLTACNYKPQVPEDSVRALCGYMVSTYPEATLQDVYKTCYQDFFGAEHLKRYRGHVFVTILTIAAVITPTGDPFTLLLVTLPIYLLYELSILIIPATYQISKNN